MNIDEKQTHQQPDDIDLLLLLERTILFFKRYKWLFIFAIIIGLSFGYWKYTSIAKTYKSRMVVHPFQLANQEEILIISNWSELLGNKDYAELSATLHCNENILPYVKQIKAEEVQKIFSGTSPYGFFIDVLVTDNKILDELQKGIVYGLENSEYVKDRITTRKNNLKDLITKTSSEIEKLDSLKKTMQEIFEGKRKASSSLFVDGFSVNRQMIDMQEKLLNYKEALQFADAVQVLQGFSKFKQPAGPKLSVWLFLGLASFLSLAYLYALISSLNEKLKIRARKNKENKSY